MKYLHKMAVAILATMAAGSFASAGDLVQPYGGTSTDPSAAEVKTPQLALGRILPANIFAAAQYGTGGVALRNRGAGGISVSGVVTPVKAAFAYWAVITSGAPPPRVASIQLQREFPPPASPIVTLNGTVVGTGASPCWGGTAIWVYKASVPAAIATGNGLYKVTLLPGASGSTAGGDPWASPTVFPLFEGVSLVIVGTGVARVAIYDRGLSGKTFINGFPGLTYSLALPIAAPGVSALFDNIGADGQVGIGRAAILGTSNEVTTLNGVKIAGPGSVVGDSDWDGNSGAPLPQLWDDTGHDITARTPRGTTALNFSISASAGGLVDCLTPVANVVAVR